MLDTQAVLKLYNSGLSIREIAEKYNTYPTKIMRLIKKYGKLRTKSQAQSLALESGKIQHPMKGKKHKESSKQNIGKGVKLAWDNIADTELDRRKGIAKINWDKIEPDKKKDMCTKAAKAIRKAAKEGSRMEKFLREYLLKEGFNVIFHKKELVPRTELEADLFVPELKAVIEIDGPSHFKPVWGQEALVKTQQTDQEKNALMLTYGFYVIRLRYDAKSVTKTQELEAGHKLMTILLALKNNEAIEKLTIVEI